MSRVKVEIWDNADNIRVAEAEHIDPREAFDRVVRMARAALPRTTEVNLEPGTYEMKLKNFHFNDATQTLLFGQVASDVEAGKYQVRLSGTQRKPCSQTCRAQGPEGEDESCSDTCAKPEGHDDWHETSDGACTWPLGLICDGKWEQGPFSDLACRHPLNHAGPCGPLED
jgi:hypothetical protein